MLKKKLYILRDTNDEGPRNRVYFDKESAGIALEEHYNDHWISTKQAWIEEIIGVSYIKGENNEKKGKN